MMDSAFLSSDLFVWVLLPLLIFLSRVLDVSIGTMRLIFVSKGFKILAPMLGFFEVTIWLLAIGQIMQHLNNIMCYIAYGAGFAMGNYIGIVLEEKMSIGTVLIRVIPKLNTDKLIDFLREREFAVTTVDVEGMSGKVKMLLSIVNRKHTKEYIDAVNQFNPKAFYTIEDIGSVKEGYFKKHRTFSAFDHLHFIRRKGK
ncbi:MAG TPA: DUF2179 domain-containing protein [Bacteroidales bacterium]|nr:DUF2179 domain-containing protein [Bacteroidales bacterium]